MLQNKVSHVLAILVALVALLWLARQSNAFSLPLAQMGAMTEERSTTEAEQATPTRVAGPWTNFANPNGPVTSPILSLSLASNGYLWVGTAGGISIRSPEGTWITLSTLDGLAGNIVFAITPDPINPQRHWFATDRGASLLDDGGAPFDKSKHRWTTFGKRDGMADNRVSSIALTADGKVWFGLSHIDLAVCEEIGFGISVLDPHNTPQDKADDTWQAFTAANSNLANDVVRRMITDAQGILWIAMQGSLTAYQNGQWIAFSSDQGLPSNDITSMAVTGRQVWIGTRQGFGVLDYGTSLPDRSDDRWQSYPNNHALLKDVAAITLDEAGRVWLGSNSFDFSLDCRSQGDRGAATVLDPHNTPFDLADDTWITLTLTTTFAAPETGVRAIALAPQAAWLSTKTGIHHLQYGPSPFDASTHQWSSVISDGGVKGNTVSAVAAETGGPIWFGQDGVVYQLFPQSTPHDQSDDRINDFDGRIRSGRALALDRKGQLWVGSSTIRIWDFSSPSYPEVLAVYDSTSSLLSDQINEIVFDAEGWAWIPNGDYLEGGLNVLDIGKLAEDVRDDRWATFTSQHSGLAAKHVTSIAFAKNHVAWLGSNTGVARLRYGISPFDKSDDVWTVFDANNSGLADNLVRKIVVDNADNVWIALAAGGVSVYTADGNWVTFNAADGLAYDSVNTVAIDLAGNVWLGTDGDGVSVLNHASTIQNKQDDQWTTYRPGETLLSGYILNISVDIWGQVWVGTFDGGLSLYSNEAIKSVYFPIIHVPFQSEALPATISLNQQEQAE